MLKRFLLEAATNATNALPSHDEDDLYLKLLEIVRMNNLANDKMIISVDLDLLALPLDHP